MPLGGGLAAGVIAFVLGFLLARYREIFFAMLSLAFSMILYGLLVKSSRARLAPTASTSRPTLARLRAAGGHAACTRSSR